MGRTDVEGNLELGEEQDSVSPRSQSGQHELEQGQLGRRLGHPQVGCDRVDLAVLELWLDEVRVLARLPELHHQVVERPELRLLGLLGRLELGRSLGRELCDHGRVSEHERLVLLLLQLRQTDRQDDLVLKCAREDRVSKAASHRSTRWRADGPWEGA